MEWMEVVDVINEKTENFENCIYLWRNKVNQKLYVGQAKDFKRRTKEHKCASLNKNRKYDYNLPLHKSIRKNGIENFEICILEFDLNDYDEMNEKEIYYIEKFDTLAKNKKGYNVASGGGNANKFAGKTEEEMKEISKKMSEARSGENNPNYGKKPSEETKRKMSEAHSGENHPNYGKKCPEHSEAMKGENNPFYGKKHSEETKRKMSENHADISGENNPNLGSLIVQVDKLTNKVVSVKYNFEFKKMGFHQCSISKCCRGKEKTHKGYRWFYLEDYIQQFGTIENHSGI